MNKNMKMKALPLAIASVLGTSLLVSPMASQAMVTYDTWTSVNAPDPGGNYIVTATHDLTNIQWDIVFTVNPWNAEGLGIFIDLGAYNVTSPLTLTDVSWDPNVPDRWGHPLGHGHNEQLLWRRLQLEWLKPDPPSGWGMGNGIQSGKPGL